MNNENISYVALLRGINVGGHVVKMEVLRGYFTELGYDNVRSYIQSGNVFFDSDEQDKEVLKNKIENQLETSLGYKVPVCLRTIQELEDILQKDPFKNIELTPDKRFAITLLTQPAVVDLPLPYSTPDGGYEVVAKTLTELFVVWHLKNGRPGNSYGLIEKKIQGQATTRFWHTLAKIVTAAKMTK